jgi:hypothetical protein
MTFPNGEIAKVKERGFAINYWVIFCLHMKEMGPHLPGPLRRWADTEFEQGWRNMSDNLNKAKGMLYGLALETLLAGD